MGATRRTRTITITVTKRILMAVTMVTRRNRTATITVTRRIPTVKITMVINNPMEDTVKSNLMVNKATVMVMATNNTEAMGVNLTDMVTNLPMVTDTNLTDMDPDLLMVDMDNNPMVMVMDTNLHTVTTTTNNLTAILLTVIPTDTKAMEVTVMAMVINNTEAMVIDKPTEDTVTNLPTDTDTKVMEAMVTNNLMVNTTATTTNLTEQRSDSNFISVIT